MYSHLPSPPQMASGPLDARTAIKVAQHWALVGASINVGLTAVKIGAGVLGHSYALVADGFESGLDVFGSLVVWGALKYASRSPDADHPYGHGKAEPISAVLVAGALCVVAVGLAALSLQEIFTPGDSRPPSWIALGVVLAVIAVKEALFRRVIAVSNQLSSTALRADAWHHRSDAITSVAAFAGILIARLGGPGWESADRWAALFACAIIGANGLRLLRPAVDEIMDAAPPPEIEETVRRSAAGVNGVMEVEKCRVRKMGLEFYVDLHVGVDGAIRVSDGHLIAHDVKDAVRATDARIADVLVHVEPANLCPYPARRHSDG